jgi:hypothetical protein
MRYLALLFALVATPALSASTPTDGAAALLAQTAGRWQGELAYRDYQSNSWQALPVTVTIAARPIREAPRSSRSCLGSMRRTGRW